MGLLYDTLGSFVALAMCGLAIFFSLVLRPWWHRDYVQAWMASFAVMGLGLALFAIPASDQTTPGRLFLTLRNGCILLGAGYQLWGWARVLGLAWPWPVAWIPMIGMMPAYFFWGSTYAHRVIVVCVAAVLTSLADLWVLSRGLPKSMLRVGGMVRAAMMAHATFRLMRAVMAWGQVGEESLFRWTAYAFFEIFTFSAVMAYLEWSWVDQWEEEKAKESGLST